MCTGRCGTVTTTCLTVQDTDICRKIVCYFCVCRSQLLGVCRHTWLCDVKGKFGASVLSEETEKRNRDTQRETIFHPLVNIPVGTACRDPGPGTLSYLLTLEMKAANTCVTFHCFSRPLTGIWIRSRASRTQMLSIWNVDIAGGSLSHCVTILALISILSIVEHLTP